LLFVPYLYSIFGRFEKRRTEPASPASESHA